MTQKPLILVALAVLPWCSHAQITGFALNLYKNYFQSGPSTVVPATQTATGAPTLPYSFAVIVDTQNASDFASGTLATCGGGTGCPLTLSKNGNQFNSFTTIPDATTFAGRFPFGSYTVTLSNPGSASSTMNYTQNLYPTVIPALTAATYNALNGLNPANGLTISFNGFTANPASQSSNTFLNIFGLSGGGGFQALTNPAGTAGMFMPPNSLLPNTTYGWYLAFSNSINSQTFYGETGGTFTTGNTTTAPCTNVRIDQSLSNAQLGISLAGTCDAILTIRNNKNY